MHAKLSRRSTCSGCPLWKANYLLTYDNEILKNSICIEKLAAKKGYKLKVKNPIDYIQKNGE